MKGAFQGLITIREVAKQAGVSIGTVSNVLNDLSTVAPKNKEKVLQAIKDLGYRKNRTASQLRSNESSTIGMLIPSITNPFYPAIVRGVEDYVVQKGHSLILCNTDRNAQKEEHTISTLLEQNIAGLILFKTNLTPEAISRLQERMAVVLLDSSPDVYPTDCVNTDDFAGIELSVSHTYELGHTRIAFIAGRQDSYSSHMRVEAYKHAMHSLSLEMPDEYLVFGDYSLKSGEKCATKLLSLAKPPTTIVCANDEMAIGAMLKTMESGFRVPQDVSIVGYDDINTTTYVRPKLTTIELPKYEMGKVSATMLFKRIAARKKKQALPFEKLMLKPHLVHRESLSFPRTLVRS